MSASRWRANRPEAAAAPASFLPPAGVARKSNAAYSALLFFTVYYFLRPEDFIPGLAHIPLAKITGAIALLALFLVPSKDRPRFPLEIKVLLLLFCQTVLTIPFAYWKGGSANIVFNGFSKSVIVAVLVFYAVTRLSDLRKLLFVQAAVIAFVTVASVLAHHMDSAGRLMGLQQGTLENPNDLAMNIAINFPLSLALLLNAKGGRKVIWLIILAFMMYGVVATYSRSGMVALAITALICIWEFGIKGKRRSVLAGAALAGIIGLAVMAAQPHYMARLETLVRGGDVEGADDKGTLEARSTLLKKALVIAVEHPLFGVGPGNYQVVSDEWHVAHNTYAELAAETGFPGLILFLVLLGAAFRKLRAIRALPGFDTDPEVGLWRSALWAGLAAYAIGSLFASSEYNLFPYFIVGYICVLHNIVTRMPAGSAEVREPGNRTGAAKGKRELAWGR